MPARGPVRPHQRFTIPARAALATDETPRTRLETVAGFFRALSDPTRLTLLEYVLAGERTCAECVARVSISQGRVSVHLSRLADHGCVTARREGRKLRYRGGDPRVAELVGLGRALAADHAVDLTCCTRIPDNPD